MAKSSLSPAERFWSKVQITSTCWLWTGNKDKDGYGRFKRDGQEYKASGMAYELAYGGVPEGMWVLHKCDTPSCVKPSHLFLGTRFENIADRVQKRRGAFGERHCNGS